ncbi:MAG: SDR family NAD(P)-dependent oxidoreductase, partial [bacterium]
VALDAPIETLVRSATYEVTGLSELARTLDAARRGGRATLRWRHTVTAPVAEIAEPERVDRVGIYSPAIFPTPNVVVDLNAPVPATLFLVAGADSWARLAEGVDLSEHAVACPAALPVPGALPIDLSTDDAVLASLAAVDFSRFGAVVAVRDLEGSRSESFLADSVERDALGELLFVVAREAYERVRAGTLALAQLSLGAWSDGRLHPETGLYAGFIKSVARELPRAMIKCVSTDATQLSAALPQLAGELRHATPAEVFYRQGARHVHKLVPISRITRDGTPYLNENSVVVATGGGRGVTALMAEELLTRFGCSIVLFGRTDLTRHPQDVLAMDDAAFAAYEPQFYRAEIQRRPERKMVDHKRAFAQLQAAHEIHRTLQRLSALPGRVEYIAVDITEADSVDGEIARLVAERGRIDLVMHGAGVQTSVQLPKRKLGDWRRTLDTKLAGLRNLYLACRRYAPRPVHFHILTSAFSYFGNDGQPDYGAANDAMNRLADSMGTNGHEHWTTIAWLAWDGIGMTRGSEYATLTKERDSYPLGPAVGREIFGRL